MGNLKAIVNSITKRKKELQGFLCRLIHDITPEIDVETMDIPLSKEEIHLQTIIGADRVPVISLTIYIPREGVIQSLDTKELRVDMLINIEETCPEVYRETLEKALDLNRREKSKWN